MPAKIDMHALDINVYLHKFFEPILFSDPMENLKEINWGS